MSRRPVATPLHGAGAAVEPAVRDLVRTAALADPVDAHAAWDRLDGRLDLDTCWDPDVLRLLGTVHANLAAAGGETGDRPVRDAARLRGVHQRNWYAAQRCRRDLAEWCTALDACGVPVRVLGGPAWCDLAGIGDGERRVDDTTLVVSPDDLAEATAVATALGWTVTGRHRRRGSRFARARTLSRPLDPARPDAGRSTLRLAVRPHVAAPVPAGRRRDVPPSDAATVGDRPDVRAEALLVALLGGPTDPPDTGSAWCVDVVRFLRTGSVDVDGVAELARWWGVGEPVRDRLSTLDAAWSPPGAGGLLAAVGGPTTAASTASSAAAAASAGSQRPGARIARWAREWRAVTRHDAWWHAPASLTGFVAERAGVDHVREVPGAVLGRRRGASR